MIRKQAMAAASAWARSGGVMSAVRACSRRTLAAPLLAQCMHSSALRTSVSNPSAASTASPSSVLSTSSPPSSASAPSSASSSTPQPEPGRVAPPPVFDIPPPARVTNQEEFEALRLKGFDGDRYDMMASYQLGQLFFDGIFAAKVAAPAPPAAASDADASSDAGAAFTAAPWSLPRNYTQSLLWFTNAAYEGHVPSRTKLGVMYLAGYGIKRMTDIALQLFTEASELGDRDAHAHLASMHLQGVGTPKDLAKAVHFFTKAAELGHVRAQAALAKILDSPDSGSVHDPVRARHWLSAAASSQHVDSQFALAQRLRSEGELAEAFRWHSQAAKSGHAQAQFIVGMAYALNTVPEGVDAAATDASSYEDRMRAAARWLSLASEQGNVGAQARMGFLCYHGVGTPKDEATALMWLSNAAEANQLDAQLQLGSIAYDEHARQQADGTAPAPGSRDEGKKLQTARAYFDKVLEMANKQCTTFPPGSLPLLVRMAQDASLPSLTLRQYRQRTGGPWLGDLHALMAEMVQAQRENADATPKRTTEQARATDSAAGQSRQAAAVSS